MTDSFLYIPEDAYLAERWLNDHSREPVIKAFFASPDQSIRSRLSERYQNLEWVEEVKSISPSAIAVLPTQVEHVPLAFYPETKRPDWTSIYPIVQKLWQAGFREFEFYSLAGSKRVSIPYLLDHFIDIHKGRRCFVVGNGPSLNNIDMKLLKDEITLGSNRCYLGFEEWGFPFNYWGIGDWLQIEEYGTEYQEFIPSEIPKFFSMEYLPLLNFESSCPLNIDNRHVFDPMFSSSADSVFLGSTVTYLLLQIAVVLGCDPIILIGADHRFEFKKGVNESLSPIQLWSIGARKKLFRTIEGTAVHRFLKSYRQVKIEMRKERGEMNTQSNCWVASDAENPTHFDPRYVAGETKRFSMPAPEISERQFDCAYMWAKNNDRQILNATPGTMLKSLPRVEFEALF